jgi:hypothetical protein
VSDEAEMTEKTQKSKRSARGNMAPGPAVVVSAGTRGGSTVGRASTRSHR